MEIERVVILRYKDKTFRQVNQERLNDGPEEYIQQECIKSDSIIESIIVIDRKHHTDIYETVVIDTMYTSLVSKIVKAFGIDLNNTDDDEYDYLSRNNETSLYTYMADIYCDREGQHLQLSDCPVLMRIDKPVDVCAYDLFVDAFLTHYEKSTGQKVYLLGRSNRHACIQIDNANLIDFNYLKKIYKLYEKEFIYILNSLPPTAK